MTMKRYEGENKMHIGKLNAGSSLGVLQDLLRVCMSEYCSVSVCVNVYTYAFRQLLQVFSALIKTN